jgi:hypothetical protein
MNYQKNRTTPGRGANTSLDNEAILQTIVLRRLEFLKELLVAAHQTNCQDLVLAVKNELLNAFKPFESPTYPEPVFEGTDEPCLDCNVKSSPLQ